ncbi:neuropeptide receptor 15-like [Rhopilema esculentum]|uniref:neuropeptide receptor 15-like n=1 Tax=Rhopilema esculentum TaxID=499914 RepID=UPI0031D1A598|eukprot:gene149-9766_t
MTFHSDEETQVFGWNKVFEYFIVCVAIPLSIVGILGNIAILYKFAYVKSVSRTQYETLLLALSVADLVCMVVTPNVFAYGTITRFRSWHGGTAGCKFVLSVLPMNVTVTQGLLIIISFQRYRALTKPLSPFIFTKAKLIFWVGICLLSALVFVSPYAYSLEVVSEPTHATMTCTTPGEKSNYLLAFASINVARDIITTAILSVTGLFTTKALNDTIDGIATRNSNESWKNSRIMSTIRVRKLLRNMITVFCFCTLPLDFFQFALYVAFKILGPIEVKIYEVLRNINTVLFLLQASNSAANIFIYARTHEDFKSWSKKIRRRLRMEDKNSFQNSVPCTEDDVAIQMTSLSKPCQERD